MPLMTWSNMLSVGVQDIDNQHKKLVDLANQLNDAMRAGQGKETLGKILNELVSYTQNHFAFEERLMERHPYPNAAAHKTEHVKLVKEVADFKSKFDRGEAAITTELMNFLRDWLSNHIMKTDKNFGKSLNEKGVK